KYYVERFLFSVFCALEHLHNVRKPNNIRILLHAGSKNIQMDVVDVLRRPGYRREEAMLNDPLSSSAIRRMLLVAVYFLAAAASFSGYFSKWHFRDDMPAASLPKMLDGTADRPYVYRQLLPAIANGIERALPVQLKQRADALLLDDNPSHHPISRMYS